MTPSFLDHHPHFYDSGNNFSCIKALTNGVAAPWSSTSLDLELMSRDFAPRSWKSVEEPPCCSGRYGDEFGSLPGMNIASEVSVLRRYTSCIPVTTWALDLPSSLLTRPKARLSEFLHLCLRSMDIEHYSHFTTREFADKFLVLPVVQFDRIIKILSSKSHLLWRHNCLSPAVGYCWVNCYWSKICKATCEAVVADSKY